MYVLVQFLIKKWMKKYKGTNNHTHIYCQVKIHIFTNILIYVMHISQGRSVKCISITFVSRKRLLCRKWTCAMSNSITIRPLPWLPSCNLAEKIVSCAEFNTMRGATTSYTQIPTTWTKWNGGRMEQILNMHEGMCILFSLPFCRFT